MGRILERGPAALLAKVAASALAVLAVVALAPAARAGTAGPRSVVTSSGVTLSASRPEVSALVSEHTITNGPWSCRLRAGNPSRWFGGTGGGVQGVGWLTCTGGVVMPQLEIFVGLARNNALVDMTTRYDTNTTTVNSVASVSPYVRASYLTAAIGFVQWPDGTISEFPEVQSPVFTI
ncbi:hypothetical protein ACFV4N_12760 [Actinosynnema sp. NPDC059797]